MPSFDIVSKINMQEVENGVNQAKKEIETRFDFRGSNAEIIWDKKTIVYNDVFKHVVCEILMLTQKEIYALHEAKFKLVDRSLCLSYSDFNALETRYINSTYLHQINDVLKQANLHDQIGLVLHGGSSIDPADLVNISKHKLVSKINFGSQIFDNFLQHLASNIINKIGINFFHEEYDYSANYKVIRQLIEYDWQENTPLNAETINKLYGNHIDYLVRRIFHPLQHEEQLVCV